MMNDIPKDLVMKLKKEKDDVWEKGRLRAIEFAKKSDYGTIYRLATGDYNDEISKLPNIPESETFIEGFVCGLYDIIEKVEELDDENDS